METSLNWPPLTPSPCPANSFGMSSGEMTDEDRIYHLSLWDQWETIHPDDPTGEVYLKQYNEKARETSTPESAAFVSMPPTSSQRATEIVTHKLKGRPAAPSTKDWKELRYRIPKSLYNAACERSIETGETLTQIMVEGLKKELATGVMK